MTGRVLATAAIVLLLLLDVALPYTDLGRRGSDPIPRLDIAEALGRVGELLPPLDLVGLDGGRVRLADFRGKRVLLTFERSLDW